MWSVQTLSVSRVCVKYALTSCCYLLFTDAAHVRDSSSSAEHRTIVVPLSSRGTAGSSTVNLGERPSRPISPQQQDSRYKTRSFRKDIDEIIPTVPFSSLALLLLLLVCSVSVEIQQYQANSKIENRSWAPFSRDGLRKCSRDLFSILYDIHTPRQKQRNEKMITRIIRYYSEYFSVANTNAFMLIERLSATGCVLSPAVVVSQTAANSFLLLGWWVITCCFVIVSVVRRHVSRARRARHNLIEPLYPVWYFYYTIL